MKIPISHWMLSPIRRPEDNVTFEDYDDVGSVKFVPNLWLKKYKVE